MPKLINLRCAYINRISLLFSRIFGFSRRTCTLFIIVNDSIILGDQFVLSKLLFFFSCLHSSVSSQKSVGVFRNKRFFSTSLQNARLVLTPIVRKDDGEKSKLDTWWVTGFADGESCFLVHLREKKNLKFGWSVEPSFKIGVHVKDKPVLIKKVLGAGRISKCGPTVELLCCKSNQKYPRIRKSYLSLLSLSFKNPKTWWQRCLKKILIKIKNKEHLSPSGLREIVALKASRNWGISSRLKAAFPDVVPAERPIVLLPQTIDPNWLAGFTSDPWSHPLLFF